jgi:tRNA(Ile)-lysidine synthase
VTPRAGGGGRELEERFRERLEALEVGGDDHLLVAVSGGSDSMVLLHLLRFAAGRPLQLTVAHLDHAMRAESAGDLLWLRGVCSAWGVALLHHRLPEAPRSEDAARRARYRFLRRAAHETGARRVLTAHHADDQAETVLFRLLRGTGLRGLRGIPDRSGAGVLRPLLPFWRRELLEYARAHRLRWREDATNALPHAVRNRIRHRLLPEAEAGVSRGARRHLLALAELATEQEALLRRLAAAAERASVTRQGAAFLLARPLWRGYDSAVASALLRSLLRRLDSRPDRAGTRSALEFIIHAPSGRELQLPGGVRLHAEFDAVRLERREPSEADLPLALHLPAAGGRSQGTARIGGERYALAICPDDAPGPEPGPDGWSATLHLAPHRFPLLCRGWRPGDRMRTPGGTKSLKKLFLERRVPRSLRHRLPVVVDAAGAVIWVGGLDRAHLSAPDVGAVAFHLTITTHDGSGTDPGPHRGA